MGRQSLVESHTWILRAWQLAILRFVVTLDNSDRLALLAIASEIDRLGRQNGKASDFGFFRRSSAELCAAILQRNEHSEAILQQFLGRIDDARVRRAFAAAIEVAQPVPSSTKQRPKPGPDLWKGLPQRGVIARD
jgi:hypothetical protein